MKLFIVIQLWTNKVLVVFFHVLYAIGWPQVRTCDSVSTARSHPSVPHRRLWHTCLQGRALWSKTSASHLIYYLESTRTWVRFTSNNPLLRNDVQTGLFHTASMTRSRHTIVLSTPSHMFAWIWVKLLHNNHSFVVRFFNSLLSAHW